MKNQLLPAGLRLFKETAFCGRFSLSHRERLSDFSRDPILSFGRVVMMVMRLIKRSSAVELSHFFDEAGISRPVTDEALRKARKKVKSTAFLSLFNQISQLGGEYKKLKTMHGMRVIAIDGSTLRLKATSSLQKEFGESSTYPGETLARISLAVDVLNGFVVDGNIDSFHTGERAMALAHIKKGENENRLYVFDRGYWSPENIAEIIDKGQKLLMRIPLNVAASIRESSQSSGVYTFSWNGKEYRLRYYKFMLNRGEMEYLVTNLPKNQAADEELKELYHLRWGIETKYNHLKNTLDLKNLSGKDALFLKQDFFATLTISNLIAFAITDAEEASPDRNLRYIYKPNATYSAAVLRQFFVRAVVEDDPEKSSAIFDKIQDLIIKNVIPVRPRRSFFRKEKRTDPLRCPSQKGAF